jgi:hypothetical protein
MMSMFHLFFICIIYLGSMTTTYAEIKVLEHNTNAHIESVIIKVGSDNIVTEAYLASDMNTNVLVPLSDGIFVSNFTGYDGTSIDVYSIGGMYYDNRYVPGSGSIYSSMMGLGGILLKSLGSSVYNNSINKAMLSNGPFNTAVYAVGDVLYYNIGDSRFSDITADPNGAFGLDYNFSVIDNVSCFCKGTQILCADGTTQPIETITPGTLVETLTQGPKRVVIVGERTVDGFNKRSNIKDRIYTYPDSSLHITGKHCVLVDKLSELQEQRVGNLFGFVKTIEGKYALPVWLDTKAQVVSCQDEVSLYHIVLECEEERESYGVCADGVWVESCSAFDFQNYSGMIPINI